MVRLLGECQEAVSQILTEPNQVIPGSLVGSLRDLFELVVNGIGDHNERLGVSVDDTAREVPEPGSNKRRPVSDIKISGFGEFLSPKLEGYVPMDEFTDVAYLQRVASHLYHLLKLIEMTEVTAGGPEHYLEVVHGLQKKKDVPGLRMGPGEALHVRPCEFRVADERDIFE